MSPSSAGKGGVTVCEICGQRPDTTVITVPAWDADHKKIVDYVEVGVCKQCAESRRR